MRFFQRKKKKQVAFEEILLDASNLPAFNQGRLEGKMELPIARRNILIVGIIFCLIVVWFSFELFSLQMIQGSYFREVSEKNIIDQSVIIAERGVVYDRNGEMLAWNSQDRNERYSFPMREYSDRNGLGQLIGYVSYPQKDTHGIYYRTEYVGISGAEASFNDHLAGVNGRKYIETDAYGSVISEHVVDLPTAGESIELSVDARVSEALYNIIQTSAETAGFRSGAGAIMNIETGEIVAMTSFPSYDPEVMADGDDVAKIEEYTRDDRFPFLNKVWGGVFTPGSVVKPFLAYAALVEGIISPNKEIVSTGEIVIPNPYSPSNPSIFRDWRAHGKMTMREAIAFSSNVYFYYISGGFADQRGLGITKMGKYFDLFGFGQPTGISLDTEQSGTVPDPEWKREVFDDDWRLGDTYFTAIGQFGWQATPIQILRAYAAIANDGKLVTPHIEKGKVAETVDLNLDLGHLAVVKEGMRMAVVYPGGTARSFERKDIAIAAKSGTAEIGADNAFVNSWAAGYFPYESPKYAFVLMMDKAPRANSLGATRIMGDLIEWMSINTPEYLEPT